VGHLRRFKKRLCFNNGMKELWKRVSGLWGPKQRKVKLVTEVTPKKQ
jgi:hypothetical protein